jgi:hypothetical protein
VGHLAARRAAAQFQCFTGRGLHGLSSGCAVVGPDRRTKSGLQALLGSAASTLSG